MVPSIAVAFISHIPDSLGKVPNLTKFLLRLGRSAVTRSDVFPMPDQRAYAKSGCTLVCLNGQIFLLGKPKLDPDGNSV